MRKRQGNIRDDGKVHCDLLMGAPVGASELLEQLQYCIVALVVVSVLEDHRAVVQEVQQCLTIKAHLERAASSTSEDWHCGDGCIELH